MSGSCPIDSCPNGGHPCARAREGIGRSELAGCSKMREAEKREVAEGIRKGKTERGGD